MSECDICYETKKVKDITCCKGKKWCSSCEEKILDKCPFCRKVRVFVPRPEHYFNAIHPYTRLLSIPEETGINMYSFSLVPQDFQPSGSINFSRIETSSLSLEYTPEAQSVSTLAGLAELTNTIWPADT
jgi:hypothetical protein